MSSSNCCTCKPIKTCTRCLTKQDWQYKLFGFAFIAISDTWTIDGPLPTSSTDALSKRLHHPQNAAIAIDLRLSRQADDGTGASLEVAFFSSISQSDEVRCCVRVYVGSIFKKDERRLSVSREGNTLTSTFELKFDLADGLLDASPEKKLTIITTVTHGDPFWGISKPLLAKKHKFFMRDVEKAATLQRDITSIETAVLKDNIAAMLTSGQLSDVTFVVGGKEFPLHRAILAARSPVFATMFTGNFKEKVDSRVEIVDIQADVFEQLVKYLYTGQVPDLKRHAPELYLAADKYQLESLQFLCEYTMWEDLSIDSVAKYLNFADHYNAHFLKMKCIQFFLVKIDRSTCSDKDEIYAQLLKSEGWQHLKAHRPELIRELFGDFYLTI